MADETSLREEGSASFFRPLPPDALIIIAVRNTVLFPGIMFPITVGRPIDRLPRSRQFANSARSASCMQRNAEAGRSARQPIFIAWARWPISRAMLRRPMARHHLVCQGEQRFQITEFLDGWPFYVARVVLIPSLQSVFAEVEARLVNLKGQAVEAVQLLPEAPPDLAAAIQSIDFACGARGSLRRLYGCGARRKAGNSGDA